jgi:hypothetical protein
MMDIPVTDATSLQKAIEEFDFEKRVNKKDLSSDQDLTLAIMNLVSIEEHLFFSGAKTGKTSYYDLITTVREVRKSLMQKLVTKPEGEEWCISKHLLAASMRLMEVGTKQLSSDRKEEAYDLFSKAYQLYSLFWGINMRLIDTAGIQKIEEGALTRQDKEKNTILKSLGNLVQKIIDCCIE